jgi:signal transduction histidine kinase
MPGLICIATCENFASEVAAVVAAEAWPDVAALHFPSRCGRPRLEWDELHGLLPTGAQHLVLMGRACLAGLGTPPPGFPSTQTVSLQQCFHLIAGPTLVDEAIDQGAYLVTPSWLANWRGHIAALGFGTDGAAELFREVARELVLLDTCLDPQSPARLAELSEAVGLPSRRVPVGLDHLRLSLSQLVMECRLTDARAASEVSRRRHAAELADQLAAMDLLATLARPRKEQEVIAAVEHLFQMLFGPAELHYLRFEGPLPTTHRPIPPALQEAMRRLGTGHAWTPDGEGFMVRICDEGETLGVIAVERLAFPEYRDRYVNLALALTGVCGLAIVNARNRRRLVEAEKLSSLSYVVAGVAHEVNTPLGVVLAAASSLRRESQQLARHFGEQSMTQRYLEQYLAAADEATRLMLRNTQRIGRLIDTFRGAAADGTSLERRPSRLRSVLEEAIETFREELRSRQVDLAIECDPQLEVDSQPGDWSQIVRNLVSNSLRHGFRDRDRGRIDIRVEPIGKQLRFEYRDDGVGLDPQVAERIFDPFFTTDLQHGLGLGMHLVYNLVRRRLDGTIECDSPPGAGVCIRIVVPFEGMREAA